MTIHVPKGWGPATVLIVLYALSTAIAGLVKVFQGELGYEEFVESMKWAAGALGLLGIGRGVAMGGPGTGFENEGDKAGTS